MILYLDWFLNKFNKYRHSIGLSFFFGGLPLVYFFRDGLKLAPQSTAFTAAVAILSLLIAFPQNPKKLFQTNTFAYILCGLYAFMALTYVIFYAPNRGWFTNTPLEIGNQLVFIMGMFIFAGTSINALKDNFLQFTLVFCVLGGLSLLYYIAKNPAYVFGMRAAISFSDDKGMGSMGNPHIYAKSAYIGLVAGVILLKNEIRAFWRLVIYGSILILLMVIAMCQAMAIVLVTVIFLFVYIISNLKSHTIYKGLKWLFGWQGILLFIGIIFGIYYLFNNTNINVYIEAAFNLIYDRVERMATSFFDSDTAKKVKFAGDDSASTRVTNITAVFKYFMKNLKSGNIFEVIFGNGYQHYYVDSPFIEMLNDLGIIGFILFTSLHVVIFGWVFKEIINPTCDFTLMVAYVFLITLIQNFTMGMPYDYGRWCSLAFIARFALSYKKVSIKENLVLAN